MAVLYDCICFKIPKEKLAEMLKTQTPDEIQKTALCGTKCGLCMPHIRGYYSDAERKKV